MYDSKMWSLFRSRPDASSRRSALDEDEQRARVAKLRLEAEIAALQLSTQHQKHERLRGYAALGGLVTGVAAVFGLLISAYQWFGSEASTRRVRIEERLDRSLSLMGNSNPASRLAAVVSLSSFFSHDTEYAPQVLQVLTNALALEESVTVRNAIVAAMQRIEVTDVPLSELNVALKSLVTVSRGLVHEGDLWNTRRQSAYQTPPHASVESRALTVASAIVVLLKKGARTSDMSRAYLSATDMTDLTLERISFDDAILAWTDFSRAKLTHSSFKDADLAGTRFRDAILTNANISLSFDDSAANRHRNYVMQQLYRTERPQPGSQERYTIEGPDFTCADLRSVNFSRHPLLPIYPDDVMANIQVLNVSLRSANLSGAKLSPLGGFGIIPVPRVREVQPFPTTSGGGAWSSVETFAQTRFVLAPDGELGDQRNNYTDTLRKISFIFTGSNWRAARLDRSVSEALSAVDTIHSDYRGPCHDDGKS